MLAEVLHPLVNQLPDVEKRRLLAWLQNEVQDEPEVVNTKLRNKLIKHITKNRK